MAVLPKEFFNRQDKTKTKSPEKPVIFGKARGMPCFHVNQVIACHGFKNIQLPRKFNWNNPPWKIDCRAITHSLPHLQNQVTKLPLHLILAVHSKKKHAMAIMPWPVNDSRTRTKMGMCPTVLRLSCIIPGKQAECRSVMRYAARSMIIFSSALRCEFIEIKLFPTSTILYYEPSVQSISYEHLTKEKHVPVQPT